MSDEHLVAHEHSPVPFDRHFELAEFVQTLDQIDVVVEIDASVFGENPITFDVRGVKQPVGRTQRSTEGVRRHGSMFDLDDSVGVRPFRLQLRPILAGECFDVGVNVDRVGLLSEMSGPNDTNVDEREILFLEPNEMNQIRHDEIRHARFVVKPIEVESRPSRRENRDETEDRHQENDRNEADQHDLDEKAFVFNVQIVKIRYSRVKGTSHLLRLPFDIGESRKSDAFFSFISDYDDQYLIVEKKTSAEYISRRIRSLLVFYQEEKSAERAKQK